MTDEQEWKYICRGCQTEEVSVAGSGMESVPTDKVRDGINNKQTAELLAKIHRIQNSGHDPEVMPDD